MRQHRLRKSSLLVALATLVLSLWVVGGYTPQEAAAHYGTGPHCSSVTSSSHAPGTHACHNHAANYYVTTSTWHDCRRNNAGDPPACENHTSNRCRRSTRSTYPRCGSGPAFWTHTSTVANGPYAGDPITSSVTIPRPACPAGSHRRGTGCHSNHVRPPCTASGYFRPHVGHSNWWVGRCPPPTTTTTSPPTTTTTTVRPVVVVTTPVSCGSSRHRHSSALPCHSHPRPSCGWYTAMSGSGHRQRYAGSCVTTTTTTPPPTTTTAPPCTYGGTHPNCDPAPVISVTGSTVDEDSGRVNFTIRLSKAVQGRTVYVNVVTSDGTANSGSDYTHVSRRVSIAANYLSASVSVPITDDTIDEPNETFTLTLSNPSRATLSTTPYAQATIRDNDLPPFVGAVANLTAVCVNRQLTLSWAPPTRGTVNDYRYGIYADPYLVRDKLASGTTTQTQATVPVTDTTVTYYAEVQARGGTNTNNSGWLPTGAIVCTVPLPVVSLNATNLSVGETSLVQVSASLDTAPSGLASMRFTLSGATNGNGSCSTGADFYVSDTEFTFTNTTSASITLYACDDTDTTDETVTLELTTIGISGLQLGSPSTVVVTIADDDTAPAPLLK